MGEPYSTTRTITGIRLVELLAPALGQDAALQAVRHACRLVGCSESELQREEAMKVLETVAEQPGLVGITGRFAKSRLLLQWK
ncbi:MAG: hypothetical protein KC766_15845 [Myxococcales bacterium]|nr:hypothetical protein [Myxococcales bacterium]